MQYAALIWLFQLIYSVQHKEPYMYVIQNMLRITSFTSFQEFAQFCVSL